jgi:VWFA-related protein
MRLTDNRIILEEQRMKKHSLWAAAFLLTLMLVGVTLVTTITGQADQSVDSQLLDESFEFKTGGTLKVENLTGAIQVEVWAEELVHVAAKKVTTTGQPLMRNEVAFLHTKSVFTVKTTPVDNSRIDLQIFVPRNTSLRINSDTGQVDIRGAVASVLVETKTGSITLATPASQVADLALTTLQGTIRAQALPIDFYVPPTPKVIQGKLGGGGNPIILRSKEGNIQLDLLDQEVDKGIDIIPASPPQSSSSDRNLAGNTGMYGNAEPPRNRAKSRSTPPPSTAPNDAPYSYGGSTSGSLGQRRNTTGNDDVDNSVNNTTDVFGTGQNTDGGSSDLSLNGVGKQKTNSNTGSQGGLGVRIIPPPGQGSAGRNAKGNSKNNNDDFDKRKDNNGKTQLGSVFGSGQGTIGRSNDVSLNGVGQQQSNNDNDLQGGLGVKIIPPPGGRNSGNANRAANDEDNNPTVTKQPPLQRRKKDQKGQSISAPDTDDNADFPPARPDVDGALSGIGSDPLNEKISEKVTKPPATNNDANARNDDGANASDNTNDNSNNDRDRGSRDSQPNLRRGKNTDTTTNANQEDDGVIRIDTNLVNLNVSVLDRGGRAITSLKEGSFQIFEDGVQQQISHFQSVNSPFNLVLLIDLSGSIIDKIDIVRRAALRFIEATRPEDKVAIVAFTRSVFVVSDLTNDRELLRQRLQYMNAARGGTAFYESMWFTLDQIVKPVNNERNAIVLLSDGVDNAISFTYPIRSRVSYEQVLRKAQETNVLIFPVYLDTESENVSQGIEQPESYEIARKQLTTLAELTGGVYFRAARVENLEGVYEKVAADLRTLYSVAYYPSNTVRDGGWRKLKVKVNLPDVAVRTRRGYYAK